MVQAHRQAWTWQDEWVNLTMEDVREIERQTQLALKKKYGGGDVDEDENGHENSRQQSAVLCLQSKWKTEKCSFFLYA